MRLFATQWLRNTMIHSHTEFAYPLFCEWYISVFVFEGFHCVIFFVMRGKNCPWSGWGPNIGGNDVISCFPPPGQWLHVEISQESSNLRWWIIYWIFFWGWYPSSLFFCKFALFSVTPPLEPLSLDSPDPFQCLSPAFDPPNQSPIIWVIFRNQKNGT